MAESHPETGAFSWQGEHVELEVLFSRAGVAQTILVTCAGERLLFDTGDGTLRDVVGRQLDLSTIGSVWFTHGHYDHIGGLYSLLGFLRTVGRKEPMTIGYPDGCCELTDLLDTFIKTRSNLGFEIERVAVSGGQTVERGDVRIEVFPMIHCGSQFGHVILEPTPAVGYRISHRGETIAISGDTGMCDSLKELVMDTDLAVIEATCLHSQDEPPEFIRKVHMSEDLAHEVGKMARDYVLIHRGRR